MSEEPESGRKVVDTPGASSSDLDLQVIDQLPEVEVIGMFILNIYLLYFC